MGNSDSDSDSQPQPQPEQEQSHSQSQSPAKPFHALAPLTIPQTDTLPSNTKANIPRSHPKHPSSAHPQIQNQNQSRIYNAIFSTHPIPPSSSPLDFPSAPSHSQPAHSLPIPRSRPATIGRAGHPRLSVLSKPSLASLLSNQSNSAPLVESPIGISADQREADQLEADQLDLLEVVDPAVRAASTLTHIQNSLFLPPSINYFASPLIELQNSLPQPSSVNPSIPHPPPTSDPLDDHLEAILDMHHRPPKMSIQLKRISLGIWAFLATPIGILFAIYGFLVVFWGAALVLILFKWLKLKDEHQYRLWVEICSQILNGLFTITGIGLLPSRIIDWYHASIILHYAHQIWRRHGRATLEDPNDLAPPSRTMTTSSSLPDVWKDDSELVLADAEVARLRNAQEKLCRSQTWYRPHSSATHYAFPIRWTLVILAFNLGNSFFQAGLCGVMWGLTYTKRPAWTTGTLMGLSFSCGLVSALLIWRISVLTLKSSQVYTQVEEALTSGKTSKRKVRSSVAAEHGTVREECGGTEDLPLVGSSGEKKRGAGVARGGTKESDGESKQESCQRMESMSHLGRGSVSNDEDHNNSGGGEKHQVQKSGLAKIR